MTAERRWWAYVLDVGLWTVTLRLTMGTPLALGVSALTGLPILKRGRLLDSPPVRGAAVVALLLLPVVAVVLLGLR